MPYTFGTDAYIERLLENYSAMLIKLAFTYVKNTPDAEDIVQDVFVSLMNRGKNFENEEHEKAWLLRVTINKCKNHLKASRNRLQVPLGEDIGYLPKEESDIMITVLELPEKYRAVIHLFYYEGYSINEIARLLAKRPATIGTWLSRGRDLLRTKLAGGFEYESI